MAGDMTLDEVRFCAYPEADGTLRFMVYGRELGDKLLDVNARRLGGVSGSALENAQHFLARQDVRGFDGGGWCD